MTVKGAAVGIASLGALVFWAGVIYVLTGRNALVTAVVVVGPSLLVVGYAVWRYVTTPGAARITPPGVPQPTRRVARNIAEVDRITAPRGRQ